MHIRRKQAIFVLVIFLLYFLLVGRENEYEDAIYEGEEEQCVIPKLDPYNADVLPYFIRPTGEEKCEMKKHGRIVDNKVFELKGRGEFQATKLGYIGRNGIVERWERLQPSLAKGMEGCLRTEEGGHLLIMWSSLLAVDVTNHSCDSNKTFRFSTHGFIRHLSTNKCLVLRRNRSDYTDSLIGLGVCSLNHVFSVYTIDGQLRHSGSGLCMKHSLWDGKVRLTQCTEESIKLAFQSINTNFTAVDISQPVEPGFIKVQILVNDALHEEYHIVFPPEAASNNKADNQYNIIMLMMDSTSHANAQRLLIETYPRLEQDPNTVIMKGHTIVGDGTTAQLCAMLTGVPEENLPEARRNMPGSQYVDRYPFIFNELHAAGYDTLFSEDTPEFGAFEYRLNGFKQAPTRHFLRPLWKAMEWILNDHNLSCKHQLSLDIVKRYYTHFRKTSKFALLLSELAHYNMSNVGLIDRDLSHFLDFMSTEEHADNTFVFIFGDHGPRVGRFRETLQGKLEERLPFMSITAPKLFTGEHPQLMRRLRENSKLLTSHFDFYETLKHVINLTEYKRSSVGRSLFTEISMERRCSEAGVRAHWCPCLRYQNVSASSPFVHTSAEKIVDKINRILGESTKCEHVKLDRIERAERRYSNRHVQKFKISKLDRQCDSCGVVNSDSGEKHFVYELRISVQPSLAKFEASVNMVLDEEGIKSATVNNEISRVNAYGSQPECIASDKPHLRKFCYCK